MKVYIVWEENGYESYMEEYEVQLVKIFNSEEKAQQFILEQENSALYFYDEEVVE